MNITSRSSGKSWRNGVICLVFMFSSWVMELRLSKKVLFLQFRADVNKKYKYVKAIYKYVSERSCWELSENIIVYYDMAYCSGDIRIRVGSRRLLLNFCWVIFWKSVMRTFLLPSAQYYKKMHIFWQFKDHNSGRQHGNKTNHPIFSFTFSAPVVYNIYFCISKYSKFIFMSFPFGLFWSVKYLNFRQKLPMWTAHHTFLESRHPEVTKNLNYVLLSEGSQKKVSAHGAFWLTPAVFSVKMLWVLFSVSLTIKH